jgi:hypothetical protein
LPVLLQHDLPQSVSMRSNFRKQPVCERRHFSV